MSIIANVRYYFADVRQEVENIRPLDPNNNALKNFALEVLNITHIACSKAVIHFPKTMVVALIISSIVNLIFFSFGSLFLLCLNLYFLYKYESLMDRSIRTYNVAHVSEWFSSPEAKAAVITVINGEERIVNLLHNIGTYLRNLLHLG